MSKNPPCDDFTLKMIFTTQGTLSKVRFKNISLGRSQVRKRWSLLFCSLALPSGSIVPFRTHHDGSIWVGVQPADQGVPLRVDGAFALDGFTIHGLAVHVERHLLALHPDHHLVPLGVEEHREAREGDGLQVAVGSHQEVLQCLLVAVEPKAGLLVAFLVHDLPHVPHLVDGALDHTEGDHEGVLVREATRKIQPGTGQREEGQNPAKRGNAQKSVDFCAQNAQKYVHKHYADFRD